MSEPQPNPALYEEDPHSVIIKEIKVLQDWKALRFFNIYRLVLASLFLTAYTTKIAPTFFSSHNTRLFLLVSGVYLALAIAGAFAIRRRWPAFNLQVLGLSFIDILAIGMLTYASGGIGSGLGMLLIVAIAGSSILTEGRTAFFFAAVASLAILVEESMVDFYAGQSPNYAQAGLLGAAFFATAYLAHVLARRIRLSDMLARQRGLHLQYLAHLNEQIVAHIQSGIVVVDGGHRIRLFNQAALRLLGIDSTSRHGQFLGGVEPGLYSLLVQWQQHMGYSDSQLFSPNSADVDLLVSFTPLQRAGTSNTLIMLEDATLTSQRAHQLKLASLGRLTASIAHEVRNPLGAISHAAQLLAESPDLGRSDTRLTQIILSHVQRVNGIVENVLQLSRQREPDSETFDLNLWLGKYIQELHEYYELAPGAIQFQPTPGPIEVVFDPRQLHQALWNLCENGLRYSHGQPLLEFSTGVSGETRRPFLDLCDHGPGMNEEVVKQVFEPFFTTETQGTGLGLYLARGFCELNQASLHILSNAPQGCCFRISFSVSRQEFNA